MTLTELKYLIAVARFKHFGRAAENCGVSQPSLSVAVRKLESELGVPVFERGPGELSVTPVGELLIEQARRVLEESSRMTEIAQRGKDPLAGGLRLGIIYTSAPFILPGLIARMRQIAPSMPIVPAEGFTQGLLEELKNGQLDCAIVALPVTPPGLISQPTSSLW
ncbi:MAG: LysR family transcriptional regulator [Duodenibacillus sp.]|nr:LysR family transcriptional regulator [Duodenibacillus sp.]